MAHTIYAGNVSKRKNSTWQPTLTASFDVLLKTPHVTTYADVYNKCNHVQLQLFEMGRPLLFCNGHSFEKQYLVGSVGGY